MSNIETGGPAFPTEQPTGEISQDHAGFNQHVRAMSGGLSIRDYFAAKAMQGMLGGRWPDANEIAETAQRAFSMADAMLTERSKR